MYLTLSKSISLTAIIMMSFTSICQITITSAHMPSAGDTIRYSVVDNAMGFDFKATGENKNWNFTGLKSSSQAVDEFMVSTKTPYVLSFGFSALGLKIADSLGSGQMGLQNVYSFFKKTSTKWEAVGIGFQLSALPLPQAGKHTNTDEIYQFPLNYKDRDSASFSLKVPLSAIVLPIGNYFQEGNRVNTVDGWGKISTPYQTNVECIRIKSVITETDSLAVEISGQPPINFAFPNNRIEYKWLSLTEKIPMLEVTGTELTGTFTPAMVRYRDNYKGTGSIAASPVINTELVAFPNPAKDKVTIEIPSYIKHTIKLFVFDMEGKNVNDITFNQIENSIELNTSQLTNGKYSVIICSGNSIHYTSITILK